MGHPARILVVDDDRDIATLLRMILEKAGYEVREAHGAEDAFERIVRWRPQMILLDVMMPDGTEGCDLVWRIRGELEPPLSETPIIMLSVIHAVSDLCCEPLQGDDEPNPADFLPVQAFLDKPTTPEELLHEVRQNLRRREPVPSRAPDGASADTPPWPRCAINPPGARRCADA